MSVLIHRIVRGVEALPLPPPSPHPHYPIRPLIVMMLTHDGACAHCLLALLEHCILQQISKVSQAMSPTQQLVVQNLHRSRSDGR